MGKQQHRTNRTERFSKDVLTELTLITKDKPFLTKKSTFTCEETFTSTNNSIRSRGPAPSPRRHEWRYAKTHEHQNLCKTHSMVVESTVRRSQRNTTYAPTETTSIQMNTYHQGKNNWKPNERTITPACPVHYIRQKTKLGFAPISLCLPPCFPIPNGSKGQPSRSDKTTT